MCCYLIAIGDLNHKTTMKDIITLIRPHQYVKNLFIFLPLFFAGLIAEVELLCEALAAFVAFSLSASAIYIVNDYRDIAEDRLHPKKMLRPLASGTVRKTTAIAVMLLLFVLGLSLMAALSLTALGVLLGYIALNIGYSFFLKHISIVDVIIIAIGFVLRLFVGSTVTAIPLSMWIVSMTFLLALFLALAKRRDDLLIFLNTGEKTRKVIDGYNLSFIDGAMAIMAAVVIMAYILYTTSSSIVQSLNSEYLYLTTLFVVVGIMRYFQVTLVEHDSASPTKVVLKDRFLQLTIIAWVMAFVWIIYL